MRRLISSLLVLIIVMTSFAVSFANESSGKISLQENSKGKSFQVVNIKVDGKTVKSADVPPIIYPLNNQGRTLVPLRMIIEEFGDKLNADIEWDGAKLEVKIKTKEKEIVLKINSATALVNGVKKALPDNVPAKLLAIGSQGRTMVPIRFFAEELGLDIGWDEKTWTASIELPKIVDEKPTAPQLPQENVIDVTEARIEMKGSIPQIRIKTLKPVEYKQFKLVNPERLVIDLNSARFNLSNKSILEANGTLNIQTNSDVIKAVRVSQFERPNEAVPNSQFITRIVADMGKTTEHKITYDDKTGELVIDFVNYIRNVKKEIMNTKEVIVIEGDSVSDYNITKLVNPNRLAIDIKGGTLHSSFTNSTVNIDGKVAKAIRVSQYVPENSMTGEKIVRVVIDLQENSNYEEVYAEVKDGKLNIHLEGEPFKAIKYEETGWTTSKLTLFGSTVTRYSLGRQVGPNLLEVVVPKKDISLELASLNINDHIIKSIDISEDANKVNYNIKLQLQDSVEYNLISTEQAKDFVLELSNKNAKYREMLIVIDPGHGGSDPGAPSLSKNPNMNESIVVLDIAKRLNQLLVEAGFRTYMTRVDDLNKSTKLSLDDRVNVANHMDADMFVSVHANAFTNNLISGIETYYHPNDLVSKKLAQIFHSEILKNVSMNDRGVRSADYKVLRDTTMASVLVETGYLSNAGDEAKLATSQYRQQVAEGMFRAIVRYFEETR